MQPLSRSTALANDGFFPAGGGRRAWTAPKPPSTRHVHRSLPTRYRHCSLAGGRCAVFRSRGTCQHRAHPADIDDTTLSTAWPVQYRVAELGEVVAAGGRVLNMIDLTTCT